MALTDGSAIFLTRVTLHILLRLSDFLRDYQLRLIFARIARQFMIKVSLEVVRVTALLAQLNSTNGSRERKSSRHHACLSIITSE